MTTIIREAIALIITLAMLLASLAAAPVPVFPEPDVPEEKGAYDEGEFYMNSYDIMVAPWGDDKNTGTEQSPLKTVEAAKEKVKALKDADCGTVTVWIREGVYTPSSTLEFTAKDTSNVIYRSYPDEEVIFSGAREFSNWTQTTVNGVTALVTDCPITAEADYFNALYNGNTRLSRPIYPKQGEFTVTDVNEADAFAPDVDLFKLHAAFYANTADVMSFKNLNDVDVRILHYWNDELLPIHSLDTATGRIEMQKPASMSINKGDRFFYENVFEALSEPGEWYLDRTAGKLYYIPLAGDTADTLTLKAGITEQLITVNGVNNITFSGITLRDTAWSIASGAHFVSFPQESENTLVQNIKYMPNFPQACFDTPASVYVTNSSGISFINCEFRCIGASGLMFGPLSTDCSARACLFNNIGGNAVYIKGDNNVANPEAWTKNITVTDCHITTYGRVFNNAIGILLVHANSCELSQNEIHDGFYTGISVGWNWGYTEHVTNNIQVTNNLIYDIGQGWLSDMGGIYTLGIQPDTVLSGNVIHDVGCYEGGSGYGGWGVYLDEGSSRITVTKNLAYNCSSQGFHQHYGEDNLIENNIFALNGDGQVRSSRKEEHNELFLYKNIIVGNDSPMYTNVEADKFTDDNNLYWDYERENAVLSGESTSAKDKISRTQMTRMGYYNNATYADPMFKDPFNADFTLAQNSPAFDIGFEEWDYSVAGTITLFNAE